MKILVVTLSNLGDVVLTLPVIQSLLKKYPEASVDVITGSSGRIVFENDARVRRTVVYDKKMSFDGQWKFLLAVRRESYDIIVDLRYSLIGLLGGARRRNSYLVQFSRCGHRTAKHLKALHGLAPVAAEESFLEKTTVRPADMPSGPYVVAAPGSKSDLKKWPAVEFARLLDRLAAEEGRAIVLVGDERDRPDAQAVASAMHMPVTDLTGRTDFASLTRTIRGASLVVTNDSAPLHIADSLKVPVLALFGPSDPKKYGPRQPAGIAVSRGIFCQPCEKAQCRYGHRDCLNGLSAADVYEHARRALKKKARSGNPRILIIRLDRIGDLVLSLPALAALRRRYPDAFLSVMTRSATRELLAGHPDVDEVIDYNYEKKGRHAFPFGYFRLLEEVMRRRFDACVVLHPGIRSYLIPFLAGIPQRIGYRNKHAWLLTQAVEDERKFGKKHEAQYALDVVAALTGVYEELDEWVLVGNGLPAGGGSAFGGKPFPTKTIGESGVRWIAIHPGASCPSKRWPAARFRDLAAALMAEFPEKRLALIGGPETSSDARLIAEGAGTMLDLSGKTGLRELAAFLSTCDMLITNDSGPSHIAAAAGTRVISLFGRNSGGLSPRRWRPLGENHAVIQKEVGCLVCLAHECPIEFECLKAIGVDDVMAEVRKILKVPAPAR